MTAAPPTGHGLDPTLRSRPDVGPRGPRLRYVVAAFLCVSAIVYLVVFGLGSNIVYFRTPSEAVKSKTHDGTHRFRLAGVYVQDAVHPKQTGSQWFVVQDNTAQVTVFHEGDTPALFKPGVPVVCEGHWQSSATSVFSCDRILIKHDNNYTPKQQVNSVTTVTVEPQR